MIITLATLAQATEQQVFDQVAKHLLTQIARSEDRKGGCLYRGPNGLKCAAGCLVADDEYKPKMEGQLWTALSKDGVVPREHDQLIGELQYLHDFKEPQEWSEALKKVARLHSLQWNFQDFKPEAA